MSKGRKEEALSIIEKALEDVYNDTVSVHSLLLRCQSVMRLLNHEEDIDWITYELGRYPLVRPLEAEYRTEDMPPRYRWHPLMAELIFPKSRSERDIMEMNAKRLLKPGPYNLLFPIVDPCAYLERLTKDDRIFRKWIREDGSRSVIFHVGASLTVEKAAGIVAAARARVQDFLTSQRIAIKFGPLMQNLLDETVSHVSSKLIDMDPHLLGSLTSALEKHQTADDSLDLREVSDICRNITQKFTELLLHDEMLPEGKARPDEDDTVGKVDYLVRWARSKIGKDHAKGTIRMVDEGTDYFTAYFKALKQRIEDVKHTPMKTVQRRQVDRAVAYLLLWMGDIITLLDRAGYDWSRGSN